jgi:hypothetical protein
VRSCQRCAHVCYHQPHCTLCALQPCCCHCCLACLQLNKSLREKLSALHTTRVLAGLLGDVLVAARRLRELLSAAAGSNSDAATVVKLLKLALDPVEQQVKHISPEKFQHGVLEVLLSETTG